MEFATIQPAGAESNAHAIVNQYFHPVASFVGKQRSAVEPG